MRRKNKGFTLIELTIVAIIIIIIVSFALVALSRISYSAKVKRCQAQVQHIQHQVEVYFSKHQAYPELNDDFFNQYFDKKPVCPVKPSNRYIYDPNYPGQHLVCCFGEPH